MDVTTLKNTKAGPHKFARAIQPTVSVAKTTKDGRVVHEEQKSGPPVEEIIVEGQVVRVGGVFNPSRFWCGKNYRLLDDKNVVPLEAPAVPSADELIAQAVEADRAARAERVAKLAAILEHEEPNHDELGAAIKELGVAVPSKKDERLLIAKALVAAQ